MVRVAVGCSTASKPGAADEDAEAGIPGATACQVQGYFDELEGGDCPDATCQVAAVDTNGGRLACCTSVASGPGMCLGAEGDAVSADETTTDAPSDAGVDVESDVTSDAPPAD